MLRYLKKIKKIQKKGIKETSLLVLFHLKLYVYFKSKALLKNFQSFSPRKKILFYPGKTKDGHVLWKLCHLNGYRISHNPNDSFDAVIYWEDTTLRKPDRTILKIAEKRPVININCIDISKDNVGKIFRKVFKYDISINPVKYNGRCVKKPNKNATGSGEIIQCPIKPKKGFSYQKIILTENNGTLLDMRVPIFGKTIPLIYLRRKSISETFTDGENPQVSISSPSNVFSKKEIEKILSFCSELGMDYGELDVLRDCNDKKIYIVDANTTPFGPHRISRKVAKPALEKMSMEFKNLFKLR